jgi:rubrerythrin
MNTKKFNISVLTKKAEFELYKCFGLQSGRDVNKFEGWGDSITRSENGLLYFSKYTNAFMSFDVTKALDFGTHTMFISELTNADVLSNEESATYSYYREHIKPKPGQKAAWTCTVCGYVHEEETFPPDFTCPICGVPADMFTKQ